MIEKVCIGKKIHYLANSHIGSSTEDEKKNPYAEGRIVFYKILNMKHFLYKKMFTAHDSRGKNKPKGWKTLT